MKKIAGRRYQFDEEAEAYGSDVDISIKNLLHATTRQLECIVKHGTGKRRESARRRLRENDLADRGFE